MDPFDQVKLLIFVPLTLSFINLINISLDLFDFPIVIQSDGSGVLWIFLITIIYLLPILIYTFHVITISRNEVQKKMNLYASLLLLGHLVARTVNLFPRFQATPVVRLILNVFSFLVVIFLVVLGIRLPSDTPEHSRHRIITILYPIVLFFLNSVVTFFLIGFLAFDNLALYGAVLDFVYIVEFSILFFILVDSTQKVFGGVDTHLSQEIQPDVEM